MISEAKIDGFRSLLDFKIQIKPGLNVLVGPNGSGKTNVIDALTFVREFISADLHTAVSKSGGAQSVFSREKTTEDKSITRFKISGHREVNFAELNRFSPGMRRRQPTLDNVWIFYEYEFEAKLKKQTAFLGVSFQSFKFKIFKNKPSKFPTRTSTVKWHFNCQSTLTTQNRAGIEILALDYEVCQKYNLIRMISDNSSKDTIEEYKKRINRVLRYESLVEHSMLPMLARVLPICRYPLEDFTFLNELNISPQKAKLPNDIAKEFGIEANGHGLSATIFRLKKNLHVRRSKQANLSISRRAERGGDLLDEIIKYTKELNSSVHDVYAKTTDDYLENNVYFKIRTKGKVEEFPISKVSDGTAKWLALMTYIVINKTNYMIEEPENFLHPEMQKFLISIIRDILPENTGYAILSTHSETLLNKCQAEEIIVVDFKRGVTTAKRIKNPKRYFIVVVDLETRSESSSEFIESLKECLRAKGVCLDNWVFGCPNKMTENWILADENFIRTEFSIPEYSYPGDGEGGKAIIKKLYKTKSPSKNYNEVSDGALYLKRINFSAVAENSETAGAFLDSYNESEPDCWWLNR